MRIPCCVTSFKIFLNLPMTPAIYHPCGFRDTEVQSFLFFPIWLLHHVTYNVIIIIKTLYMSSCTNGEHFVSIRQEVGEKNMKVLCRQTNKQTDKQTNGPKCDTLSKSLGEGNDQTKSKYINC